MLFNSLSYAVFLPIVFVIYWKLPHNNRWVLLLIASYYFYMSWNAKYVFLIFLTTFISYLSALQIRRYPYHKKTILITTLIVCLGTLFIFKYLNFFFDIVTTIFSIFSIKLNPFTSKLLLPVGISFYTFQTLSYVIDVYKEKIEPETHFGYYATFVSFFPQLVAGPIERPENLLPQLKEEKLFDYNDATYSLKLMAWGFFKKIVVADNLAVMVDKVYANIPNYEGFAFVLAAIFFSIEIYCDFSGYSDIAKGSAGLLGIKLMDNFKSPYLSTTIKEFWSKWHISLSSWFKDYVYIPLGGNRCSKPRHYLNLIATFLVSGLWHGASITFVIWGAIHGILQIIEDIFHIKKVDRKYSAVWFARVLFTFIIMMFAWIFFRAQNIGEALYILNHMFTGISSTKNYIISGLYSFDMKPAVLLMSLCLYLIPLFAFDICNTSFDVIEAISRQKTVIRYIVYFALLLSILFLHYVGEVNFIYFQF